MITGTNTSTLRLRRDDIKLTDEDIISRYLGVSVPCSIQSPLREDDIRPSFSMRKRDGRVQWKDFGTGEHGDALDLMSRIWHVSVQEAMLKMKLDTDNRIPRASLVRRYNGKLHLTGGSEIDIKTREWKDWDIEFWKSFGITKSFAVKCNVYPVSHAFFTHEEDGRKRTVCVPMDKYAYAYVEWKDDKRSIKLYQPFSQTMKWLSKHDASVWDLWRQAFLFAKKRSDSKLIITSSRKDAMCLWNSLGVPCMSLQGEGYMPKPNVMRQVLDRFKTVYLWYDNDYMHKGCNPGQDNARKLTELYPELHNICIPESYGAKDPSDLYKLHGIEALREVWNNSKAT